MWTTRRTVATVLKLSIENWHRPVLLTLSSHCHQSLIHTNPLNFSRLYWRCLASTGRSTYMWRGWTCGMWIRGGMWIRYSLWSGCRRSFNGCCYYCEWHLLTRCSVDLRSDFSNTWRWHTVWRWRRGWGGVWLRWWSNCRRVCAGQRLVEGSSHLTA